MKRKVKQEKSLLNSPWAKGKRAPGKRLSSRKPVKNILSPVVGRSRTTAFKTETAGLTNASSSISKVGLIKAPKFSRQGQTRVVAFVRDPRCLFIYWEVGPDVVEGAKRYLKEEYHSSYMVLRAFRTGLDGGNELFYETKVEPWEKNYYLHLEETGGSYFLEVGQKTLSGKYISFARSGKLMTARGSLSPVTDPKWAPCAQILEYYSQEEAAIALDPEKRNFSGSKGRSVPAAISKKIGVGADIRQYAASHYPGSRF